MPASLLVAVVSLVTTAGAARSAELLQVRLGGLELPLSLPQLEAWSQGRRLTAGLQTTDNHDLPLWLSLLEPAARDDLRRFLQAPLLRDRSFGQQLLSSWAGERMLAEVGALVTGPDGSNTAALLQRTLRRGLERQGEVTTLALLRELPLPVVSLQLDGLLVLGQRWRRDLNRQTRAFEALPQLGLPLRRQRALSFNGRMAQRPRRLALAVAHRPEALPLSLWRPAMGGAADRAAAESRPLLLVLPGLGGTADQLAWLADALATRGWPVLVLQHPGSDEQAMKAALDGHRPPPGAESLPQRQADIAAVLTARRAGAIPGLVADGPVVLIGHSLGGVAALLAAGLVPEPGLEQRCRQAIERLPISNPSQLLQCQLATLPPPARSLPPPQLRAVVLLNSFGSLLWPSRGLADLPVPLLMVGGSLDLVTPPLSEQLDLFVTGGDPARRLALVQGGSHFSPVRLDPGDAALFRLGDSLVGVEPARVQGSLLSLIHEFLRSLEEPLPMPAQRRSQDGVTTWLLDPRTANRWRGDLSD
ncbi:MAG: alpha/beta fold hydrolase [Cyanobacteriota bacterium]|nr:alpha/beta fold hydrolase [Cyanobacteriota bacterium]